jgi:hypothetical protein
MIEVLEIRCQIFRCGVLKESGEQIHPHLKKEECDELVEKDLIYGCGKPFRIIYDNELMALKAVICDYI